MRKRIFALSQVYRLLEPGPVVLVTTARKRRADIMTMSWHTMMEFEPPIVGSVISNRNHTFGILKATRECVINIPLRHAPVGHGADQTRLRRFLVHFHGPLHFGVRAL